MRELQTIYLEMSCVLILFLRFRSSGHARVMGFFFSCHETKRTTTFLSLKGNGLVNPISAPDWKVSSNWPCERFIWKMIFFLYLFHIWYFIAEHQGYGSLWRPRDKGNRTRPHKLIIKGLFLFALIQGMSSYNNFFHLKVIFCLLIRQLWKT